MEKVEQLLGEILVEIKKLNERNTEMTNMQSQRVDEANNMVSRLMNMIPQKR